MYDSLKFTPNFLTWKKAKALTRRRLMQVQHQIYNWVIHNIDSYWIGYLMILEQVKNSLRDR